MMLITDLLNPKSPDNPGNLSFNISCAEIMHDMVAEDFLDKVIV